MLLVLAAAAGCSSDGEVEHTLAETKAAFAAEGLSTMALIDLDHTVPPEPAPGAPEVMMRFFSKDGQPLQLRGVAVSDDAIGKSLGEVGSVGKRWQLFVLDSEDAARDYGEPWPTDSNVGFVRLQADNVVALATRRYVPRARRALASLTG
jgi:hypothetical protein